MPTNNASKSYDVYAEWPFIDDPVKIRVYNPKGNIAIVIGRVKGDPPLLRILELLPKDFPLDHVAAIGTVWTLKHGIERIVQNLITNPYIDTVVLCGDDSKVFFPLAGLYCLKKYGVNETKHVIGYLSPENKRVFDRDALVTLSHKDIDHFRRSRVQIINMIGHSRNPKVLFRELKEVILKLGHKVESPSFDFLRELNVWSWKSGREIKAQEVFPGDVSSRVRICIEFNSDTSEARVVYLRKNVKPVAISIDPKHKNATQAVVDTLLGKRIDDAVFRDDYSIAYVASGLERTFLSIRYPNICQKFKNKLNLPFPIRSNFANLVREFKAKRRKIQRDPKGYFRINVDYEENRVYVEYFREPEEKKEVTIQGDNTENLLATIIKRDYVGKYEGRARHIAYLAVQLEQATFALLSGIGYQQDAPLQPQNVKNVNHHVNAAVLIQAATLEEAWVKGLLNLKENGLITTIAKGRVVENWATLFHIANVEEMAIPKLYPTTADDVYKYVVELFQPVQGDIDSYTYGDRECHHWYDQISDVTNKLKRNHNMAYVTQRWDPLVDWKLSHAPCLIFSIWFIQKDRLNTFQAVRSHDIYGGMPQNALGIVRGWGTKIAKALNVRLGDLVFLSVSNNYRVADNAREVKRVINHGVSEKKEFAPHMNRLFVAYANAPKEAIKILRKYVSRSPKVMLFPSIFIKKIDENCEILDSNLIEATLAGKNIVGQRLRNYHFVDQILVAAKHLKERNEVGDRTNRVVLTPRDPILDKEKEVTDLLMIQLRYQLGHLHAAGVFVNSTINDFPRHISYIYGIQRYVAELIGSPVGSIFIQYAPLLQARIHPKTVLN